MPRPARIPIEAQTSRISFKDECEDVSEQITCDIKDAWAPQGNWNVDIQISSKKGQFSSVIIPTDYAEWCSLDLKMYDWNPALVGIDWKKFDDLFRRWTTGHQEANLILEKEFNELAAQWYQETRKLSLANQIVLHPAYQKIIGMGRDALPFIFRELKKTRGHWIWALAMILRDDKAKPGMKFREAVDAWLEWGKTNDYI